MAGDRLLLLLAVVLCTRFMTLAKEAGAIYKVGASALVNTEIFEEYLEQYHETPVPLPKHVWDLKKIKK